MGRSRSVPISEVMAHPAKSLRAADYLIEPAPRWCQSYGCIEPAEHSVVIHRLDDQAPLRSRRLCDGHLASAERQASGRPPEVVRLSSWVAAGSLMMAAWMDGLAGSADQATQAARELHAALPLMACRVCGCTDAEPCQAGCHWADDYLCSACDSPWRLMRERGERLIARIRAEWRRRL